MDKFICWNVIRSLMMSYSDYGGYRGTGKTFRFKHDINLIIVDEPVESIDIGGGWGIPTLEYLISNQVKYKGKDLNYIQRKFNYVIH